VTVTISPGLTVLDVDGERPRDAPLRDVAGRLLQLDLLELDKPAEAHLGLGPALALVPALSAGTLQQGHVLSAVDLLVGLAAALGAEVHGHRAHRLDVGAPDDNTLAGRELPDVPCPDAPQRKDGVLHQRQENHFVPPRDRRWQLPHFPPFSLQVPMSFLALF